MSYLGKADCHLCDREVDVSANRAGMAYYRCAACGAKLETKHARADRALREQVRPFDAPDDGAPNPAPEPAANPGKSPENPEPNNPPRAKARAGFWSI
ncbi:hypothetical protein QZM43_09795 [Burkholderia orbicola]|uniref:hypothetical protein n=1 Tax=Burkholderia orbicola TaxID=2978683 RepID=UPI00264A6F9F|nr:hypothetical protein [Burkholderia orbicola]ELW9447695.1 hypothetical protein [Burkholderia cenocepacia]MDN7467427.1 hypothetical protein [Burkholderia orbicola]MDN7503017.1 hypothetical protein [Burkholderia orbicola]